MHGSCKRVNDAERFVIIVLVVSFVLCGEAVTHVRIPRVLVYMVATTTHTNLHSSSIT